jgi:hypothetical protein
MNRRANGEEERRQTPAYEQLPIDEVTWASFYGRFKVVEQLEEDVPPTPPIVRQVLESKERIRSLDLKFYAILGAVVTGFIGTTLIRIGVGG